MAVRAVMVSILLAGFVAPRLGHTGTGALDPERSSPRIELSDDDVLVDERVAITVEGLEPEQEIRLVVSMVRPNGVWQSQASFTADRRGRVPVSTTAPTSGDYEGVDPMGLFWSARPPPGGVAQGAGAEAVERVDVTAQVDGQIVASTTLLRRHLPPDVDVRTVREEGLVGTLSVPAGRGPHPKLLVLGGSEGGIPSLYSSALAAHGYVVLALAYFDPTGQLAGLPRALSSIPLEYFATALDWLQAQPPVDADKIGIVGASRGAELALLLASEHPDIKAVVAYAPSHVVWPDLGGAGPAWSRGAEPVVFVPASPAPGPLVDVFRAALEDQEAVDRAAIPVERINGGVLLVSGEDDQLWPSTEMADAVTKRLRDNDHPDPFRHLAYRGAGHVVVPPHQPTTTLAQPAGSRFALGGNPVDAAEAAADHWPRVLRFLARNL